MNQNNQKSVTRFANKRNYCITPSKKVKIKNKMELLCDFLFSCWMTLCVWEGKNLNLTGDLCCQPCSVTQNEELMQAAHPIREYQKYG